MTPSPVSAQRLRSLVVPLGISSVAFAWCWVTGSRGFFALDQSIALDGGWRILGGQVPFVDFWTPHGLPLMAALAGAFRAFGATHATYLGFAAAENALFAWLTFGLARRWTGSVRLAAIAGLGGEIWFQAPHGTPFPEQAAFLCALAVWRLLAARGGPGVPRLLAGGALSMLSILCKQNAGALTLLLSIGLWWHGARARGASIRNEAGILITGFGGAALGFAAWLFLFSDPAVFWRSYVAIPADLVAPRFEQAHALSKLVIGRGPFVVHFATLLACLPPWLAWRRGGARATDAGFSALFCLGLHFQQTVFTLLTHNHPEDGYPFVALSLVLGAVWVPVAWSGARAGKLARVLMVVSIAWVLLRGVYVGWSRTVHTPVFHHGTYAERLPFEGWRTLRWGDPTLYHGESTELRDLVALVQYLEERPGNVFAFPEYTFLYMLLGRPSPQPLLWFDEGVTYPEGGSAAMDARIVSDLVAHDVRTVVIEERAFLDAHEHLRRFPRLAAYLRESFRKTRLFGPFQVLER